MDKIKITKLVTDLAGFSIGGVISGIMVIATYSFLKTWRIYIIRTK